MSKEKVNRRNWGIERGSMKKKMAKEKRARNEKGSLQTMRIRVIGINGQLGNEVKETERKL